MPSLRQAESASCVSLGQTVSKDMFHLLCDSVPECHRMSPIVPLGRRREQCRPTTIPPRNAKDIIMRLAGSQLPKLRRRDLSSAIGRACQMMCCAPEGLGLEVPVLRQKLAEIRPAAHGI